MNKLFIIILTALFVFNVSATEEKLEKLTLSGPFAAVSMALRKTKTFPMKIIAPDLYRSTDLQKEWG